MRIPRFGKQLLAAVLAVVGAVVITGAASADSGVKFTGQAPVLAVVPGPSTALFDIDHKGRIRSVEIATESESMFAAPLTAECRKGEAAEALCESLNAAAIMSFHDSVVRLNNPEPRVVTIDGIEYDALAGQLNGSLQGAFLLPTMGGTANLNIRGSGVYACPVPIAVVGMAACIAQVAPLVPVQLDVKDQGRFTIDAGTAGGGAYAVSNGSGQLTVDVNVRVTSFVLPAADIEGTLTIRNASATLTPIP